jgi:small-conductance mechanosensitive channel
MDKQLEIASQTLVAFIKSIQSALPSVVAGLLVFSAFVAAAVIGRSLVRRLVRRTEVPKQPLVRLAADTLFYVVLVFGLISGLGTMRIDVSALVASLGLTGFALGFALRDAVSNLIAGVLILLYEPFSVSNTISVGTNRGVVAEINLRYTVLRTETGTMIYVPNSTMFSSSFSVEPPTAMTDD